MTITDSEIEARGGYVVNKMNQGNSINSVGELILSRTIDLICESIWESAIDVLDFKLKNAIISATTN
jgi:hypothetical protein